MCIESGSIRQIPLLPCAGEKPPFQLIKIAFFFNTHNKTSGTRFWKAPHNVLPFPILYVYVGRLCRIYIRF